MSFMQYELQILVRYSPLSLSVLSTWASFAVLEVASAWNISAWLSCTSLIMMKFTMAMMIPDVLTGEMALSTWFFGVFWLLWRFGAILCSFVQTVYSIIKAPWFSGAVHGEVFICLCPQSSSLLLKTVSHHFSKEAKAFCAQKDVSSAECWLYPHSDQTQKSNATSGFCRLELCKNFKRKLARLL